MKTEYLEEGVWVYIVHPGKKDRTTFTFARIRIRDSEKPFSKENSYADIPGYGWVSYSEEDIVLIFPKVKFKPIHVLIDKIAREE